MRTIFNRNDMVLFKKTGRIGEIVKVIDPSHVVVLWDGYENPVRIEADSIRIADPDDIAKYRLAKEDT